jgi:hypothetical protein
MGFFERFCVKKAANLRRRDSKQYQAPTLTECARIVSENRLFIYDSGAF